MQDLPPLALVRAQAPRDALGLGELPNLRFETTNEDSTNVPEKQINQEEITSESA